MLHPADAPGGLALDDQAGYRELVHVDDRDSYTKKNREYSYKVLPYLPET